MRANEAKNNGITIIPVGVGEGLRDSTKGREAAAFLKDEIASTIDEMSLFTSVTDFKDLSNTVGSFLSKVSCS